MDLTSPQAFHGLKTEATPQAANISNNVTIGKGNAPKALSSATTFVTCDAIINGATSDFVLDLSDLDSTGTTAWTAGTAQVETATVVGTITTAGNAEVIFTAADVTGSPITLSVAVADSDTASQVATKIRADLTANTAISTYYTIGGSGADITATHKGTVQYTIQGTSTPVYPANDATLNISIDNDTCAGLTTAATSTDTTAGVASAGVYVPALDGNDFEGIATGGASNLYAVYIGNSTASGGDGITITQSTVLTDYLVPAQGVFQATDAAGGLDINDITIEPENAGPCLVEVVLATS
jgi:hypothetical protein